MFQVMGSQQVMIADTRRLCGLASLLQGMVDPGEVVTTTVKRKFIEEVMDFLSGY